MPNALEAISLVENLSNALGLDWINRGRVSDDWKTKIFQHRETGLQFAVYNRKTSILVLLEQAVDSIQGVQRIPRRPRGDSLKVSGSKFTFAAGVCYDAGSITGFELLIRKYLAASDPTSDLSQVYEELERGVAESLKDSPERRRERLRIAPRLPKKVLVQTTAFLRNPDVVAEVLLRANGHCEVCARPAPFLRAADGKPYLEVHHRIPLAQGGEDCIDNALAACPNCHRHAHHG